MTFRELRAKLMEMNETDLDEEVQCVLSDSGEVFSLTNIVDETDGAFLVLDLLET